MEQQESNVNLTLPQLNHGEETMRDLTTLEQPPFLLAIFLACLSWAITWYVGILEKSPIIAYDIEVDKSAEPFKVTTTIENLTSDKTFRNLEFIIHATEVTNASIEDTAPAWHGDKKPEAEGQTAVFNIPQIQPGWKFKLIAEYEGDIRPYLQLKKSNETIRLIDSGFGTLIFKFQVHIIFGIIFLWGGIILFIYRKQYCICKSGNQKQIKNDKNETK